MEEKTVTIELIPTEATVKTAGHTDVISDRIITIKDSGEVLVKDRVRETYKNGQITQAVQALLDAASKSS